ncbi:hypothetical protein C1X64_28485 [Pseudomonas sp. GW456-E7]|nr:hypothetical protein C1X64_28485 [Pseudomonas sp. GW456-E7]
MQSDQWVAPPGVYSHSNSPQPPLWERACSRRGLNIQHLYCLTHRFREQARSHRGFVSPD